MLNKEQRKKLRTELFRHLDGIVTIPSAYCLYAHGAIEKLLEAKEIDISDLSLSLGANEGYLNVAFRVLASQGWIDMSIDNSMDRVKYSCNDKTEIVNTYLPIFKECYELLQLSEYYHHRRFEEKPFRKLESIFNAYRENCNLSNPTNDLESEIQHQMLSHIEGIIIGPSTVHLGMGGMFHKYFMETNFKAEEFHEDAQSFGRLLDMFTHVKWFEKKNETFRFSDKGLFFARRASAYGVTVSYIPTLRKLDDLIFGNPKVLKTTSIDDTEKHVDRAMNVWGSGGAHSTYFKVVDDIIRQIFNQPIEKQPKGILDMGCGNGAFIQHLFDVIEKQTERGKMLDEHPLILVGVDYNKTALKITKANLIQADIWAKVIWGDIGQPDLLASNLSENYGIDLHELLNVRTFLDHNRPWNKPKNKQITRTSTSSGAFATSGKRLSNNEVEESLFEHFKAWAPHVKQHGLLLIELHTISPSLTAANIGNTPATAYDATHGYSDQYIVELEVFLRILNEAGLKTNPTYSKRFPDSDLATVSINLIDGV